MSPSTAVPREACTASAGRAATPSGSPGKWGFIPRRYIEVSGKWKIAASGDWYETESRAKDGCAELWPGVEYIRGIAQHARAVTLADIIADPALCAEVALGGIGKRGRLRVAYAAHPHGGNWIALVTDHDVRSTHHHDRYRVVCRLGQISRRDWKQTLIMLGALAGTDPLVNANRPGPRAMWAQVEDEHGKPLREAIRVGRLADDDD